MKTLWGWGIFVACGTLLCLAHMQAKEASALDHVSSVVLNEKSVDEPKKQPEEKKTREKKRKERKSSNESSWTTYFPVDKADLASVGHNPYFILEPGYVLILEGGGERLVITVTNETKKVDGVETRMVEERETKNDKLIEVSRNYFAISKKTNCVFYFGEEVDNYKNGKIVDHKGSWLSGEKGAKFGLMMPGLALVGARYYQEQAPGDAMDRAEILSVTETYKTPAGEFKNCLKTEESTPLEPGNMEYKHYAPGIGLIQDGNMKLVKYGKLLEKK